MTTTYEHSVAGAQSAAADGELAEWTADFLASPGSDNADLAEELREMPLWDGPVRLPFDELHRLAGPPDQPTLGPLGDDDIERVEDMKESFEEEDWEPPPFIVSFRDDHLVLEDGTHRIEGLRRAGLDDYWCVVCFADEQARSDFQERWGD